MSPATAPVDAAGLRQRRLDVEARVVELRVEAEALTARAADLLAEGADARGTLTERAAVLGEIEAAGAASERLLERTAEAGRAELRTAASERLKELKRQAGGSRGEAPRALQRGTDLIRAGMEHWLRAGELARETSRNAAEAELVKWATGVEAPAVEQLDLHDLIRSVAAEVKTVSRVPQRVRSTVRELLPLEHAILDILHDRSELSTWSGLSEETAAVIRQALRLAEDAG